MANLPADKGRLEFMIKLYPDGRFSGLLASGDICAGTELRIQGPYGVFTLRDQSPRRLLFVGGGAGMAPILCLLRSLADRGIDRPAVYYYGARTERDLIMLDEIAGLAEKLPNFTFVPCLSHSWPDDWPAAHPGGATGFVTEVLEAREPKLRDCDVYLCGPPPMIDAALPLMKCLGVPSDQLFYDKFTITAAADD
jgi:propane monooxygenase reductase subunit